MKKRTMRLKSDNMEIMINDKAAEVMEGLLSLLSRNQIGLETSMKGSDFVFDCVHLLYQIYHKTNPSRSGSYINFPNWIKSIKSIINVINKNDDKCFQYAATVAIIHEEIKKDSKIITKIKPFIDKYNWE